VAKGTRIWACLGVVAVLVLPVLGCSGGGDNGDTQATETGARSAVDGSFVGRLAGGDGFIAVVAAPAAAGQDDREVELFVADGSGVSEWFSGSISDNRFVAESNDGDAEAKGTLSAESVVGSVELPDGKTVRYKAGRPGGAAGLYYLNVTAAGKLKGASAAGLGVTGAIKLEEGTGTLRLADGRRLRFDIAEEPTDDLIRLRAGQVRLIVLPSGEVKGAGMSRPGSDEGSSDFFVRSPS
jgi:hypothetical protein